MSERTLESKKLWLAIVPARRPSEQRGMGPPQKGVNYNFSWPEFDKPLAVRKLSISDAQICSFSRIGQKIKNYSSFNFLPEKLEKFHSTELYGAAGGIDNFFFVAALWAVRQWKAVDYLS